MNGTLLHNYAQSGSPARKVNTWFPLTVPVLVSVNRPVSTKPPDYSPKPTALSKSKELQDAVDAARDVMDACYEQVFSSKGPDGRAIPLKTDVDKWTAASKAWTDLLDKLTVAEAEDSRKTEVERGSSDEFARRKKAISDELMTQYGDHGPQYRLLVDMVASKKVRMEVMEMLGHYNRPEYDALSKLIRDDVGQLQKYTEASKSISASYTKDLNEVMAMVMGAVEVELEHQPTAFQRILVRVQRMIESSSGPMLLAPPTVVEGKDGQEGNTEGQEGV